MRFENSDQDDSYSGDRLPGGDPAQCFYLESYPGDVCASIAGTWSDACVRQGYAAPHYQWMSDPTLDAQPIWECASEPTPE